VKYLRLLKYALPNWRGLGVVLGTMLLSVGLDIVRPWPMKLLVDNVLGKVPVPHVIDSLLRYLPASEGPVGLLFWISISTVIIFIAATCLAMINSIASTSFGQRMTFDLGADLFLHLQRLSLKFHSRQPLGDTISRVSTDSYGIQTLITGAMLPLLQSLISLIAMFSIMWNLHSTMTLLSLSVVPFLWLTITLFKKSMKDRTRERRDLEGQMMNVVQQTLSAMPAVQAFTREEYEHSRFRRYADKTVTAYEKSTQSSMWFKLFVGLVTSIGTAAIIWIGGNQAIEGKLSVGTILVFLAYLSSLYGPMNSIAYTASTIQGTAANIDRVMEVIETPIEVNDHPDAEDFELKGHVHYSNVDFSYQADFPTISNISFDASPGEVIAMVGPTGAGKTTIVNLLVRFFDPASGYITIDGRDIRHIKLQSLRRQIAIVLQEPFIFPISVADNIAYGRPDATRDEIIAASRAANADDFIQRLSDGYDTIVGERGATLSGGEKQRLSIARAFLKNAPILILDEPTSALDARTEAKLLDALDRLMIGRTVFIIAHRLSTVRHADNILVIDRGSIIERGTHADLIVAKGLYAALYQHQMNFVQFETTAT
jgi:ABC-type multidrug transport system, ATPase and permease components